MTVISNEFTCFFLLPVSQIFLSFSKELNHFLCCLKLLLFILELFKKVGIYVFLLLVCFFSINVWTRLFALCWLYPFPLFSLT